MTTYAQYLNGETKIGGLNEADRKTLVLGWLVANNAAQTETRYALFWGGRILKSEPIEMFTRRNDSFSVKGGKWVEVNEIPADAEFIGRYPAPKQ
jgi:hypothetical protein